MTLSIPHLRGLAERAREANAADNISDADAANVFADFGEEFSPSVCIDLLDALERAEAARDAAVGVLRECVERNKRKRCLYCDEDAFFHEGLDRPEGGYGLWRITHLADCALAAVLGAT